MLFILLSCCCILLYTRYHIAAANATGAMLSFIMRRESSSSKGITSPCCAREIQGSSQCGLNTPPPCTSCGRCCNRLLPPPTFPPSEALKRITLITLIQLKPVPILVGITACMGIYRRADLESRQQQQQPYHYIYMVPYDKTRKMPPDDRPPWTMITMVTAGFLRSKGGRLNV